MTNANWYNFHFFQKLSNGQKNKTQSAQNLKTKSSKRHRVCTHGTEVLCRSGKVHVSEGDRSCWHRPLRPLQVKQDRGEVAATDSFTPIQYDFNYLPKAIVPWGHLLYWKKKMTLPLDPGMSYPLLPSEGNHIQIGTKACAHTLRNKERISVTCLCVSIECRSCHWCLSPMLCTLFFERLTSTEPGTHLIR